MEGIPLLMALNGGVGVSAYCGCGVVNGAALTGEPDKKSFLQSARTDAGVQMYIPLPEVAVGRLTKHR